MPDWQPQWHLTMATREKSRAAEFLVLADLGCTGAEAQAVAPLPQGGYALQVNGLSVAIDERGGSAAPTGPRAGPPACKVPPKAQAVAHRRNIPSGSSGNGNGSPGD